MGIPLGTAAAAAKASFLKRYWKWFVGGKAAMAAMLLVVVFFTFAGVEASKSAPSDVALADIPPVALEAYLAAGDHCNGLTWNILAGIGKVESNHGRVFGGVIDGDGDVVPPIFGAALNGSGAGGLSLIHI